MLYPERLSDYQRECRNNCVYKNSDTRASRLSLVKERLSHLEELEPYADKKQEKLIADAKSSIHGLL